MALLIKADREVTRPREASLESPAPAAAAVGEII